MSELDVNPAAEASQSAAPAPVLRPEHAEGVLAPVIEQQAAKIPVALILARCDRVNGAITDARADRPSARKSIHRAMGAPLLIMGMYNKRVKTLGRR